MGPKGGGERPVAQIAATTGTDAPTYSRDRPGVSAFALQDGAVYHTYSSYSRGVMGCGPCISGSTARRRGAMNHGRPTGRSNWFRRHDEY